MTAVEFHEDEDEEDGVVTQESVMSSGQMANRVMRYHTWPVLRHQSVGEHEARVTKIYCAIWGLPRAEVLYYCLHHDDGELAAGDTPFYAKRAVPALKTGTDAAEAMGRMTLGVALPELTEEEWRRFKMADYLEMWEYGFAECCMGNRYAEVILTNLRPAIAKLAREMGDEDAAKIDRFLGEMR